MNDLLLPISLYGVAAVWHIGSGMYLRNRWDALDYAQRWDRMQANRELKRFYSERDAQIKRLIHEDELMIQLIDRAVEKALKKVLKSKSKK